MSKDLFDFIKQNDHKEKEPYGWIQWKGTNVCIDLLCTCGYHGHCDADFFYYYKCPQCNKKYAVGQVVKLIELNEEQSKEVENTAVKFQTDLDYELIMEMQKRKEQENANKT